MALAVNPELTYKACRVDGELLYSLTELGPVEFTVKGSVLAGKTYQSLFNNEQLPVLAADFVTEDKTALVIGLQKLIVLRKKDEINLYVTTEIIKITRISMMSLGLKKREIALAKKLFNKKFLATL